MLLRSCRNLSRAPETLHVVKFWFSQLRRSGGSRMYAAWDAILVSSSLIPCEHNDNSGQQQTLILKFQRCHPKLRMSNAIWFSRPSIFLHHLIMPNLSSRHWTGTEQHVLRPAAPTWARKLVLLIFRPSLAISLRHLNTSQSINTYRMIP